MMGQVTIYLDEDIEKRMTACAKAMKVSKSKWIADVIRANLRDEWPQNVREMAGSWKNFQTLEETRGAEQSDIAREQL